MIQVRELSRFLLLMAVFLWIAKQGLSWVIALAGLFVFSLAQIGIGSLVYSIRLQSKWRHEYSYFVAAVYPIVIAYSAMVTMSDPKVDLPVYAGIMVVFGIAIGLPWNASWLYFLNNIERVHMPEKLIMNNDWSNRGNGFVFGRLFIHALFSVALFLLFSP